MDKYFLHNKTTTNILTTQQQRIFLQRNNYESSYNSTTTNLFTTKQLRIFLQLNNTSCAHQDCSRGASNVGGELPKHMLK